jgi:hypothetical protein
MMTDGQDLHRPLRAKVVLLSGESGIGKSRLTSALMGSLNSSDVKKNSICLCDGGQKQKPAWEVRSLVCCGEQKYRSRVCGSLSLVGCQAAAGRRRKPSSAFGS